MKIKPVEIQISLHSKFPIISTMNAYYYFTGEDYTEEMIRHDKATHLEVQVASFTECMRSFEYCCNLDSIFIVTFQPECALFQLTEQQLNPTNYQIFFNKVEINKKSQLYFLNTPPKARQCFGMALHNDLIVIFGGEGCNLDRSLYFFDLREKVWYRQEPSIQTPEWRTNCQLVFNKQVYLLRGNDYERNFTEIYSFQLIKNYRGVINQYKEDITFIQVELVQIKKVADQTILSLVVPLHQQFFGFWDSQIFVFSEDFSTFKNAQLLANNFNNDDDDDKLTLMSLENINYNVMRGQDSGVLWVYCETKIIQVKLDEMID